MAVVLRLPDRRDRAAPSPDRRASATGTAEIVILPCIRRERLAMSIADTDGRDLPTQRQA